MRPSSAAKTVINGSRPSPLKINKDSRMIQRQPVIIYTHSPKIIHTKPHDFMALVQKLTGMSSSAAVPPNNNNNNDMFSIDDNCVPKTNRQVKALFGDDIPLFTPKSSSSDFFCSPRPNYRLSEGSSPNWLFDFVEGVPEY